MASLIIFYSSCLVFWKLRTQCECYSKLRQLIHLVTCFLSLTFGIITSGNFVFLILRNWEDLRGLEADSLYISNIFLKVRHAGSSLRCESGILFERVSTISPNQSSASIKHLDSNVMPFLAWTWLLSRLMAMSFFHL